MFLTDNIDIDDSSSAFQLLYSAVTMLFSFMISIQVSNYHYYYFTTKIKTCQCLICLDGRYAWCQNNSKNVTHNHLPLRPPTEPSEFYFPSPLMCFTVDPIFSY